MKKLFLLIALLLMVGINIEAQKREKQSKTPFPEEYEVFESGDWELHLFYWNKNSAHRMTHGVLYLRGRVMPDGNENDLLATDLGYMRYVLRAERNFGVSGWVPDGGLNLELYKVKKVLGAGALRRAKPQNNPDLKDLTEEERMQQLLQQEYEWKHGPQSHDEESEHEHNFTFE